MHGFNDHAHLIHGAASRKVSITVLNYRACQHQTSGYYVYVILFQTYIICYILYTILQVLHEKPSLDHHRFAE